MANSKKLVGYSGSSTTPSVPTAIDNILVRTIADDVFTSNVDTVEINTYANDITGSPPGELIMQYG